MSLPQFLSIVFLSFTLFSNAQAKPHKHYQADFTATEKEQLWHLSEGADFLPLRWFLNLKSAASVKKGSPLYTELETKFGLVGVQEAYGDEKPAYASEWTSPMKWVGLTLAWSEPTTSLVETNDIPVDYSDKKLTDNGAAAVLNKIDTLGSEVVTDSKFYGQVQVPMVGTNCALCHSGSMKFNGENVFVEGAPNMLNVRNFFRDMTGSAIKTMVKPKLLTAYLQQLRDKELIPDESDDSIKERADVFVEQFKQSIIGGKKDRFVKAIKGALSQVGDGEWDIFDGDGFGDTETAVLSAELSKKENQEKVAEQLAKFLALSYPNVSFDQVKNTPSLWNRMMWLAMILNVNPQLAQTAEGYGRTDAFGRISNAVARGDNLLPLVAPVSFPPMWSMEYTSLFHYNGNTNSVIMRNVGQSFGLGALLLDDKYTASSNLGNLNKMEKLIYKIKVPEWNALVPKDQQLQKDRDHQQVMQGCDVYLKTCWGCHDSQGQRVGKNKRLIKHDVFSLKQMGTDPNHAMIQGVPVITKDGTEVPFRQALFTLTKNIKERFIELMAPTNPELQGDQLDITLDDWGNFEVRGMEHFRDPYLGEDFSDEWLKNLFAIGNGEITLTRFNEITEELDYMKLVDSEGVAQKNTHGYIAKDLAGIWASAPYLHNGSVPTIWHLISEQNQRPSKFITGCKDYDTNFMGLIWSSSQATDTGCLVTDDHWFNTRDEVKGEFIVNGIKSNSYLPNTFYFVDHLGSPGTFQNGNQNTGHNFVVKSDEDKKALIAFLKVLRPPAEYSWKSDAWYKIEPVISEAEVEAIHNSGKKLKPMHMKCTAL